jgi:hypothetical protein
MGRLLFYLALLLHVAAQHRRRLYTLEVQVESSSVGSLAVYDGEEVADAVAAFASRHPSLGPDRQVRMVDHLCGLYKTDEEEEEGEEGSDGKAPLLLCSRRTPRRLLFDLSVIDPASRRPYYLHFHDVGDTPASVAAEACEHLIPSCRRPSLMEQSIAAEVERRLRAHYARELASDCFYTRLGFGDVFPRSEVSDRDLRRAFHERSRSVHPDKPGGDADVFLRLKEAHAVLSSFEDRREYDEQRRSSQHQQPSTKTQGRGDGGVASAQQRPRDPGIPVYESFVNAFMPHARVETDGLNVKISF